MVSAAAAGAALNFPRIGYQTFTFDLLPADVTVSTEVVGSPADAPLRPDTAEYWQATALPATWQIDLGATRSVDYVGIAGHNIGSSAASCLIETSPGDLVGSPPAFAWTTFAADVSPSDDSSLLYLDDAVSCRHVRITLAGSGVVPKLAVAYIGVALVMEREVTASGFKAPTLSRQTELNNALSRGGQFLGQNIRRMGVASEVNFQNLDQDWYRTTFDPFVKHARRFPYFFAWWPEQYPLEIAYVWTDQDIAGTYMGLIDLMQVNWSMNGIGNL